MNGTANIRMFTRNEPNLTKSVFPPSITRPPPASSKTVPKYSPRQRSLAPGHGRTHIYARPPGKPGCASRENYQKHQPKPCDRPYGETEVCLLMGK